MIAGAALKQAQQASQAAWLADLRRLLDDGDQYFADLCWRDDNTGDYIHGHKAILYARGNAAFQAKYLNSDGNTRLQEIMSRSTLALPLTTAGGASRSMRRSPSPSCHTPLSIDEVPGSATMPAGNHITPVRLRDIEASVLRASLDYLYTASPQINGVISFLFDDAASRQEDNITATERLAQDLLFAWRSRLFADVQILLEDQAFPTHRAVISSRCPYFKSSLTSGFADENERILTLPSSVFDAVSVHHILHYMYTGSISMSDGRHSVSVVKALDIWQGAQYLSMDNLLAEIKAHITEACHSFKGCHVLCRRQTASVFAFACRPEIMDKELQELTRPVVVRCFGDAWTADIGSLEYDIQKTLITSVCTATSAMSASAAFADLCKLKSQIAQETAMWADHIRSMLVPLEERIAYFVRTNLEDMLVSDSFTKLLIGVAFSGDILTALLSLIVASLTETSAPHIYQALVGKVLLREEGLASHPRQLIEDARSAILAFIKIRWMNIRDLGGFDELDNWALKEISDEIEETVDDLLFNLKVRKSSRIADNKQKPHLSKVTLRKVSPEQYHSNQRQASMKASMHLAHGRQSTCSSSTMSLAPTSRGITAKSPATLTFPATSSAGKRKILSDEKPARQSDAVSKTAPLDADALAETKALQSTSTEQRLQPRPKSTTSVRSMNSRRASPALRTGASTAEQTDKQSPSVPTGARAKCTEQSDAQAVLSPVRTRVKSASRSMTSIRTNSEITAPRAKTQDTADGMPTVRRRTASAASAASKASLYGRRTPLPAKPVVAAKAPLHAKALVARRPAPSHTAAMPAEVPLTKRASASTVASRIDSGAATSPDASVIHRLQPPGTTLNVGIPCVITYRNTKFRGTVRYLGEVLFTTRVLVGVEVRVAAEQTSCGLEWTEGVVEGVKYFDVNQDGQSQPSKMKARQAGAQTSRPSISQFQDADDCVSRGAFVDPSQVLYVF